MVGAVALKEKTDIEGNLNVVSAGYKQIELGIIPNDWEVFRLDSIGEPIIGLTYSPKDVSDEGVLVLRSSNIQANRISLKDSVFVSCEVPQKIHIKENDILICVRNGSKDLIGKCALLKEASDTITFGAFMSVFRSDINSYIVHQLQSNFFKKQVISHLGATINQITNKSLNSFLVVVPSKKKEQKAIAQALSDADEWITSLESLIEKKKKIKAGVMQSLLSGKKRLNGFDGDWEEQVLGKSAILKARIGWQGLTTAEYLDTGDYQLVTGTEFENGRISWNKCHFVEEERYKQDKNIQLKEDDVLVTKDGTIGKVAIVKDLPLPATLNSGVFVIRPIDEAFHPEFFFYLLKSDVFTDFLNKLSAGSTINHLYQKDFVNFKYFLPPTEKEQIAIANILSDMDSELSELDEKLEKAKSIKQGMMQVLLTGKVRLV